MSQEVEQKDEKGLVEKVYKEIEDLYKDLGFKSYDINRVVDKLQKVIDAIDTYDDDDEANNDTRRETPWYLEQYHDDLLKMIEELQDKAKEINEYRKEVGLIKKYVELVKDKLNGQLNIDDLRYMAKVSIDYGYITIKFNNVVHLASRPLTSETSINELMIEAIDLRNIKSIIMGMLITIGIREGQDIYEGNSNELRDYVVDRLKYILDLFKTQ